MLSAGDLIASQRKLESRGKEVQERARQKAEKERLVAERAAARAAAREEEARQRLLAQLAAEEEERQLYAAELEANNGVLYRAELIAVPAPESIAADKGIKRAADKILLPPSAGASLMGQDAYKNGPMFFQLTNAAGNRTHAGLLEFSAAEGFVALPRKVIRSLWGPDAAEEDCAGKLKVAYRRLPKGERAVFQPRSATFQSDVGAQIREVLEAALRQHSCLTRGDWLTVQHAIGGGGSSSSGAGDGEGGVEQQQDLQQEAHPQQYQRYDLKVCELHPEGAGAVSVIDTDLEAEINPSIETEERIREEYEAASQRAAEAALAAAAAARQQQEAEAAAVEEAAQRERWRLAKEASLPPEPPADAAEPTAACLFRFPDGGRHSRRFLLSSPLQLLFDFVDSKGASGLPPGSYSLVTQYPRRVFLPAAEQQAGPAAAAAEQPTLAAAGLAGPREVLFLEQQQQQHLQQPSGCSNQAGDAAA